MGESYRTLAEVRDHVADLIDDHGEDTKVECDADGVRLDGVQTYVEDDAVVFY